MDNVQPDPFGVNWSGFLTGAHELGKVASQLNCERGLVPCDEIDCGTITENYSGSLYAIGSPARMNIIHSVYGTVGGGNPGGARIVVQFQINDGGFGTWETYDELHVTYIGPTADTDIECHTLNTPYDYSTSIGGTIPPITSDLATITACAVDVT